LFIILWAINKKTKQYGIVSAFFLIGYGSFRFIVEFFREPDQQLGFYFTCIERPQLKPNRFYISYPTTLSFGMAPFYFP
ncbi:MAG: prolipoprotein diacylglyceryl transferase family protein, partial [Bacteroidota bacterium]